jgi:hypothetical protein
LVARLQKLIGEGAASASELVEAQGRLNGSRDEYAGVKEGLAAVGAQPDGGERFELRASAPGRVLTRGIAPGERTIALSS